jgi:hypothetical protein
MCLPYENRRANGDVARLFHTCVVGTAHYHQPFLTASTYTVSLCEHLVTRTPLVSQHTLPTSIQRISNDTNSTNSKLSEPKLLTYCNLFNTQLLPNSFFINTQQLNKYPTVFPDLNMGYVHVQGNAPPPDCPWPYGPAESAVCPAVLADDMLETAADDWYDALSEMGEDNHWLGLGLDDKDDSHAESSGGSESTSSATLPHVHHHSYSIMCSCY